MRQSHKIALTVIIALLFVSGALLYEKTRQHVLRDVPQYSVTDLNLVSANDISYEPSSINEQGSVAGVIHFRRPKSFTGDITHAFLWKDGKFSDLGALGGEDSEARKINEQGWITGTVTLYKHSFYLFRTFLWHNNTVTLIPLLPAFDSSIPIGISTSGRVFGFCENAKISASLTHNLTLSQSTPQEHYAYFQYFAGKITSVVYTREYQTLHVNNRGMGIGAMVMPGLSSSSSDYHLYHACLWKKGKPFDLGTLGGPESDAQDINDAGLIAGSSDRLNASHHACLWEDGKAIDLGDLGGDVSYALALNNHNEVVGYSYPSGYPEPYHAFVWRNGEIFDLNKSIPPDSGWQLRCATGLNNRGQIIGWGFHNGQSHAFVLTPKAGS